MTSVSLTSQATSSDSAIWMSPPMAAPDWSANVSEKPSSYANMSPRNVEVPVAVETDGTTDESLRPSDGEAKEVTSLQKKVNKYRKRNKELSDDFARQRRAFLELEKKYDILKLQFVEVKAEQDVIQAAAQEHMMVQDLQLLDLAHEHDGLVADLKKASKERDEAKKRLITMSDAIHDRDSHLIELANECNQLAKNFEKTAQERDGYRRNLAEMAKERDLLKEKLTNASREQDEARRRLKELDHVESPECHDDLDSHGPNTASRWARGKRLLRLPRRGRRLSEDLKVVPVG